MTLANIIREPDMYAAALTYTKLGFTITELDKTISRIETSTKAAEKAVKAAKAAVIGASEAEKAAKTEDVQKAAAEAVKAARRRYIAAQVSYEDITKAAKKAAEDKAAAEEAQEAVKADYTAFITECTKTVGTWHNNEANVKGLLAIIAAAETRQAAKILDPGFLSNEAAFELATALRKITVDTEEDTDGLPEINKDCYKAVKAALIRIFSAFDVTVKTDNILFPLRFSEAVKAVDINAIVSQYVRSVKAEYKKDKKSGNIRYTGKLAYKYSLYSRNTKAGVVWFSSALRSQLGELLIAKLAQAVNKAAEKAQPQTEKPQTEKPQTEKAKAVQPQPHDMEAVKAAALAVFTEKMEGYKPSVSYKTRKRLAEAAVIKAV